MTERCSACGYNFAFGRVHRCVPRPSPVAPLNKGNEHQRPGIGGDADAPRKVAVERLDGPQTYKYRDPDKRRAQVREAVARYRARKHAVQENRT